MGETRVDLLHLLEDLRDAYPGALEETILTEIVANSLDSGARRIELFASPTDALFTAVDDGRGMSRRELARYHDLAASTKRRGSGIGFAGVGIKLGLLACNEVVTETRRGKSHVASVWHLSSRHRAPWKWQPPTGLVTQRGTAVRLHLANPLSPLLDAAYIEAALLRHYQPLFEPSFDEIIAPIYPDGIRFEVNGRLVPRGLAASERVDLNIRVGRKRKPSATGYLVRFNVPLPEDHRGVAVSTLGKIIRRGWDWLAVSPAAADRISGLIEAPQLAEALTLNKADFIRTGARGAVYLAYRKAIQEVVTAQLAIWGDVRDPEETRHARTRPIERDLENVLVDLADSFPLLAALVEKRPGGQRRLPLAGGGSPVPDWSPAGALIAEPVTEPGPSLPASSAPAETLESRPRDNTATVLPSGELPADKTRRRPARYGLEIRFENRPEDPGLGRLIESTVWVNTAHPAYTRAAASRAEAYHIALTVAMSLAPLAAEPAHAHSFVTAFLACWGETALEGKKLRRKRK
jgi:hypothetical protein